MSNPIHPSLIVKLVTDVQALQVELPRDLTLSVNQLKRLPTLGIRPAAPRKVLGLTDAQMVTALRDLGVAYALTGGVGVTPSQSALDMMSTALAAAVADELAARADEILDQLRPAFNDAAKVLHRASELGLHSGTTMIDVLDAVDVAAHRDAWVAIPAASRTLEQVADVRIQLSMTAGVPPAPYRTALDTPDALETMHDAARLMFHDEPRTWKTGPNEEGWQRWLRLCTGSPARLLTVEESSTPRGQDDAA